MGTVWLAHDQNSFPRSRSLFGVDDLAVSVAEIVVADGDPGGSLARAGAWRSPAPAQRLDLVTSLPSDKRTTELGFRLCADAD